MPNASAASRDDGRGSVFAEFQENQKGMTEPGKLAGLAALSQDIFTVPVGQLPGTESIMTMTDGEIVYSSGALKAVD
jgi:hypothetical protein